MIVFDQLYIDNNSKRLVIEASIENLSYFDNVEIDKVVIDSQDTYIDNGPSSNPILVQQIPQGQQLNKHIKLEISEKELGIPFNNNMLFIYVFAKGYPSPDTPCGYDNNKIMGIAANLYPYYQSMMSGVKEISDTCNIPKYFINNILRFKAIELSIKTGNYSQAIKYWKKFFSSDRVRYIHQTCGCYGRNN